MCASLLTSMAVLAAARTLVVAPVGTGEEKGTVAQPFTSLAAALALAQPGDRIELAGGFYAIDGPICFPRSGELGRWITVAAKKGEEPILDGTLFEPTEERGDWRDSGILHLRSVKYVRVEGLTIFRSPAAGIKVDQGSAFIDLVGNRIDSTFCPGIALWNSQNLRVLGNEVTRANTQDERLFGDYKNEAPHEAISVAGIDRFEVAYNHVHHCTKEGIDVKEISRNGVVHHNWVHDLRRQGIYVDAWFGLLKNVEVRSNLVEDCEWGLALSVEGRGSRAEAVTFADNLVRRTRSSGFFFGTWGGDGPRHRITVEHNTFEMNGQVRHWAGPGGAIDLRSPNATEVKVCGNLILRSSTFPIALREELRAHVEVKDNRTDRAPRREEATGMYGTVRTYAGPGLSVGTVNPSFGVRGRRDGRLPAVRSPFGPDEFQAFRPDVRTLPRWVQP